MRLKNGKKRTGTGFSLKEDSRIGRESERFMPKREGTKVTAAEDCPREFGVITPNDAEMLH
jgi:hypothetical protein